MKGVRVVIESSSCGSGNHSRLRGQQHHELPVVVYRYHCSSNLECRFLIFLDR
jgi:hypothetical protein